MKKLDKSLQEKVEIIKADIIKLQNIEDELYNDLIKEIGWDNDWLYDYIFNCSTEDEYSATVRKEIFE